ncbi:thioesterase II family protein [Chitinophaga nivalis]|uniref:Alpha/beta fold hydrolase n=1 Tax=Chitinophaga nivalis TaxID=2991709 RepID=A0ABT3IJ60_9BACT|nr:alpha/beta fold hydrolase [Chitinophaga nivalis]MCW3466330.1 alpha/beta fold hydrolase [Chitinophaga nivalis]MCW3483979.1 alpha/beta fold hydrolase [Chitinophaga nivalis]
MEKINLICLPFAGGNKHAYRHFEAVAPSSLRLLPFEYPGRGQRTHEPLLDDVHDLAADIYRQVKNILSNRTYAIYGHSLGGLIAYLLTRMIVENGHEPPAHLYITGTSGPADPARQQDPKHLLPIADFINIVREMDGSPAEVLQHEELLHYLEPILRADFKASELYRYEEKPPLDIPITVVTGTREVMSAESIRLWQQETTIPVDFRRMPGNHFFINRFSYELMQLIAKKTVTQIKTG